MSRLIGNWPVSEETATAKIREFRSIYESHGHERFSKAVQKIIHESQYKYFPSVGEFMGYVPKPDRAFWRDANCECKGTGFVDAGVDDYENPQVARCNNPECLHIVVGAKK